MSIPAKLTAHTATKGRSRSEDRGARSAPKISEDAMAMVIPGTLDSVGGTP